MGITTPFAGSVETPLGQPSRSRRTAVPSSREPVSRWTVAALLSVGGGLSLWVAFPPFGSWALAVGGPLTLAVATRGRGARQGAVFGMLLGLAFMAPLLKWTGAFVGDFPWLALSVVQAAFYAALGAATAAISGLRWWPLWAATLWVGVEAARSRVPFGGFPWGRIGFSQVEGPFASLAAYGGVALVTFAVALTGSLLGAAVVRVARRQLGRPEGIGSWAGPLVGALLIPGLGALAWLPLPGASLTDGGETATVAVVQGDVPRAGLEFNAQRRAVLDNHVQQTLLLAERVAEGVSPRPDLVIWPENSSDIDPYQNDDAAAAIGRAAEAIGAPILVGAVLDGPGENLTNTGIVWDPANGAGASYAKRHPVPFGEYMPLRSFFRIFSDQVDLLRRDFVAGEEPGVLDIGGVRIGDVICFEVAYDSLVSDVIEGGASLLVVQTNNATFGYTAESEQQLAMSRLRAIEHGRSVVVAATSGISAVVAPDGTVVRRSELFTPRVFVESIAQRQATTVATRLGALPEWALTAAGLGALLLARLTRHRLTAAAFRIPSATRLPRVPGSTNQEGSP